MNIFPIAIRTLERSTFLDTTIRSLKASDMPDCPTIVIDDCSVGQDAQKHLYSDERFMLTNPITWPNSDEWTKYIGRIRSPKGLTGISKEMEVMTTGTRKGDVGGIFWIVDYMMTRFTDAPAIIIIEADCVARRDWYTITDKIFTEFKEISGPVGNGLGMISGYDRWGKGEVNELSYTTPYGVFRNPVRREDGRWNFFNSVASVMLLFTREFYERCKKEFQATYGTKERACDQSVTTLCTCRGLNTVATYPTCFQHVGFQSLCWINVKCKDIRAAKNFRGFCFEKFDQEGYAYSDKWIL